MIPDDIPNPRGKTMSMHCVEYADHASKKVTCPSQTGILILCNQAPIMWLSKKQNSVQTLTFRSKFTAIKLTVELVIAFRYKLRMFGVPLEGPTDMFCDNKAVFNNTSTPNSVVRKITSLHIINAERLLPPSFVYFPRKTQIST